MKCEGSFYSGWCFYLILRWPFEKNQLFSQPDVQLHHKMHCLVKNMWCWIWASYTSRKKKFVHSSNNRILHRVEFIPCECYCWISRQLLNLYTGDFRELIGLGGNVGSYCKIFRWFCIGELSHNLKPPEGEPVKRNTAKCVEAEAVVQQDLSGIGRMPFCFCCHGYSWGGEHWWWRGTVTLHLQLILCVTVKDRVILTRPALILSSSGLATPQRGQWSGWWLGEGHGHHHVTEDVKHNLGSEG